MRARCGGPDPPKRKTPGRGKTGRLSETAHRDEARTTEDPGEEIQDGARQM
jgi:hypothetical protein